LCVFCILFLFEYCSFYLLKCTLVRLTIKLNDIEIKLLRQQRNRLDQNFDSHANASDIRLANKNKPINRHSTVARDSSSLHCS
jgi:hypothetical protein